MSPTPAAPDPLPGTVAGHGPVLIHRSGGRCDGSSPMAISRSAILARRRSVSAPRGGGGFPRARPSARYRSRRRRPRSSAAPAAVRGQPERAVRASLLACFAPVGAKRLLSRLANLY
ncbi:MAG: DUF779 domain-containing protein, partial [Amaricoccus sp.]|uniref:DUF779 domain-containing protein n=1 Tax=Amaricoccus sp. TaxID=1872485 RepID=UPI003314566B